MIFGYARVSTKDQNLDIQLDALQKAGCNRIFQEKESGAKNNRPERELLLQQIRPGDTLIIYKFDRLVGIYRLKMRSLKRSWHELMSWKN